MSILVNLGFWCTRIEIDKESNGVAMAIDCLNLNGGPLGASTQENF